MAIGAIASCTDQEWRTYRFASSTICSPSLGSLSTIATAQSLTRELGIVVAGEPVAGVPVAGRMRPRLQRYPPPERRGGAMTELAQAPAGERREGTTRISHWIGGRIVPGESGRSGPVYNPATGEQTGAVDFASVDE